MRDLYLHIGHNKTGSSFLQAALINSIETLEENGIVYPVVEQMQYAKKGRVSTGNGALLGALFGAERKKSTASRTLFSSEMIFEKLLEEEGYAEGFLNMLEVQEVERLRVLLFTRNPVSHACSAYQQRIKRRGESYTIEHFFMNEYETPRRVGKILNFFQAIPYCEMTVCNYDHAKHDMLEVLASWLQIERNALTPPPNNTVNRSLSISELELQKMINRKLGKVHRPLSDYLVNELPHIVPEKQVPSIELQEWLWKKFAQDIAEINANVPPHARYEKSHDIQCPTPINNKDFVFTSEQLEVIASYIHEVASGANPVIK